MTYFKVYSRAFFATDDGHIEHCNERYVGIVKGAFYCDACAMARRIYVWRVNTDMVIHAINPYDRKAVEAAKAELAVRENENREFKAWMKMPAWSDQSNNCQGR